jgi:hypothetical protein
MRKIVQWMVVIGLALAPVLSSAPAEATLFLHTWVASTGTDANDCDRGAPCATFGGAYNKTVVGGEITCADSGDFGYLTIKHSITINCTNAIGSTTFGGNFTGQITITTAAADVVVLKGLDLDGSSAVCLATTFDGSGELHLEKMKINQIPTGCPGISFTPKGPAKLFISDSDITNNGGQGTEAGVYVGPQSGVEADVVIDRTHIEGNYFGVVFDGTQGGIIRGAIHDSVVSGNIQDGIMVSATNSSLAVDNTIVSSNGAGVLIKPNANGSMTATFDRVTISNNMGGGLKTDTTNGPVNVDISNSTIGNNGGNGLNVIGGAGGPNVLNLSHDVIASNGNFGLQSNGVSAAAFVDTTLFATNVSGATASVSGGRLLTYSNNRVVGPIGPGFPSSVPLQ